MILDIYYHTQGYYPDSKLFENYRNRARRDKRRYSLPKTIYYEPSQSPLKSQNLNQQSKSLKWKMNIWKIPISTGSPHAQCSALKNAVEDKRKHCTSLMDGFVAL